MMSPDKREGFELLEHTADAGVRAWAESQEGLFRQAARGMYALMLAAMPDRGATAVEFQVSGDTPEDLLVHFLSELLFTLDSKRLAAVALDLDFSETGRVRAASWFGPVAADEVRREIKSPTFHQLHILHIGARWETSIYFDL